MQDLSRYRKKDYVEIRSKYISLLLVGSVALVGLVFALGVLVGGRRAPEAACESTDPLAALDVESGEPAPPEAEEIRMRSYHRTLDRVQSAVPTPASLGPEDLAAEPELVDAHEARIIENVRHEEEPLLEKVSDLDPGTYSLQVASFQDQGEASLMVNRLKRAGHRAFLVGVNMPERGGRWYRVRVGPFKSKKKAWTYKKTFEEKERLATFVVKKRSEG